MHFPTLLTAAATFIGLASAAPAPITSADISVAPRNVLEKRGCYSGGEKWGADKARALEIINAVCSNGQIGSAFPGVQYGENQHRWVCSNLSGGRRMNIQVGYRWTGTGNMKNWPGECVDYLASEVNCEHGGETYYQYWYI